MGTIRNTEIGTASRYDVTTMVMQQKEMYKFNRNLGKSLGRGPRQAAREAKDRAEQMRIAEDFVNIFDDEQAVLREAEQAQNPIKYIPGARDKHKSPDKAKSKKTVAPNEGEKEGNEAN